MTAPTRPVPCGSGPARTDGPCGRSPPRTRGLSSPTTPHPTPTLSCWRHRPVPSLPGTPGSYMPAVPTAAADLAACSFSATRPPTPTPGDQMRILVLGGTRFIGRHLVTEALVRDHELTLLCRAQTPS